MGGKVIPQVVGFMLVSRNCASESDIQADCRDNVVAAGSPNTVCSCRDAELHSFNFQHLTNPRGT